MARPRTVVLPAVIFNPSADPPRPLPLTVSVWVPPVPVVVVWTVVQVVASAEVWIWNAVAYAASPIAAQFCWLALIPIGYVIDWRIAARGR